MLGGCTSRETEGAVELLLGHRRKKPDRVVMVCKGSSVAPVPSVTAIVLADVCAHDGDAPNSEREAAVNKDEHANALLLLLLIADVARLSCSTRAAPVFRSVAVCGEGAADAVQLTTRETDTEAE